ncbi:serine/threonine-protein kinase [Arthrobacter sp. HLT1-21]
MDSTPAGIGAQHVPDPAPPVLHGYHNERLLGRGGSASVWLIRNAAGEAFALKVIDPATDVHIDPATDVHLDADALRREERFLARFRHDHLLAVHDLVATEQGTALRMEYAAGGSLLHLISVRGPLPPGEVVTVLTPMAQVLAYLHDEGAAHGDVSPGNIVFTELGKPLLADFGIGRLLGEGGRSAGGTPGFHEGSPDPDRLNTEADIYALAAVGWFALTGRVPGPAMQRPPLSLLVPETPAELLDLINWGLDGDPAARPGAHEFARAVQRTAQAEPLDLVAAVHPEVLPNLRTRRSYPDETATRPGRRRRRGARRLADPRLGRRHSATREARLRTMGNRATGNRAGAVRSVSIRAVGVAGLAAAVLTLIGLLISGVLGVAPALLGGGVYAVLPPSTAAPPGSTPPGSTPARELPPAAAVPTELGGRAVDGVPAEVLAGTDPRAVLPYLSKVREHAYETADPALLQLVNVRGSTAMAADSQAVAELASRGHILAGLTIELTDVAPATSPGPAGNPETGWGDDAAATAVLIATATTSGYTEVVAGGTQPGNVEQTQSSPVTQQLFFVLEQEDGRWRIRAVHEP